MNLRLATPEEQEEYWRLSEAEAAAWQRLQEQLPHNALSKEHLAAYEAYLKAGRAWLDFGYAHAGVGFVPTRAEAAGWGCPQPTPRLSWQQRLRRLVGLEIADDRDCDPEVPLV